MRDDQAMAREAHEAYDAEETISDYDYDLPTERIAQTPVEPRDSSRLLVVQRATGTFAHHIFREIGGYLRAGDLLVANQSRVLPARLRGVKEGSGGQVEVLLLAVRADLGADVWEALVRPGRRLQAGQRVRFSAEAAQDAGAQDTAQVGATGAGRALVAEIGERTAAGGRIVRLVAQGDWSVAEAVTRLGSMPLPPYIHTPLRDAERYQTVYAREPGSAAAPTAGLHFTPALLDELGQRGVGLAFVTLHIGLDTFRPIVEERLDAHTMHSEAIELDAEAARLINAAHAAGGRIIAVGTTAVRTLESVALLAEAERERGEAAADGRLIVPYRGRTTLFIRPGYRFRAVDALITNFHLPRSTLLALVSAFAGRELMQRAYAEAIAEGYRFYSFGDAMLIL